MSRENEGEMAASSSWCINCWSAPRSLSTSLMYSFAQRSDTEVVDEPLYANFLKVTGAPRPYRQLVLDSMDSDGRSVIDSVVYGNRVLDGSSKLSLNGTGGDKQSSPQKPIRYVKHMAKQCSEELAPSLLSRGKHVLLIRHPLHILSSFSDVISPSLSETGLPHLLSIYSHLAAQQQQQRGGGAPIVVDADCLQAHPRETLQSLCAALDIDFDPAMLAWPAGPRPEDGCWAPWWYATVHSSTSFAPLSSDPPKPFPPHLYSLLEECWPFYSLLKAKALRPGTASGHGDHPAPSPPLSPSPSLSIHLSSCRPPPSLPVADNERILSWVTPFGLVPREQARVHVFDSITQGGDGVWEGLRIYNGRVFKLQEHLNRLMDSAKALHFASVPSREEVVFALLSTLSANGMRDNTHVRLTLTRGVKVTSGMSPHFNQAGCTLIVLAEWKPPVYDNSSGVSLITASTRRNPPQCLDSKIHHNNLLNNILAKIEGNRCGADDAVMLDIHGFVSETNATNIFVIKNGTVLTPLADSCLPGITRATVIQMVRDEGLPLMECNITPAQLHFADEIFTTGTMGELTPCIQVDGRPVGDGAVGDITKRLQLAYKKLTDTLGWQLPF